MKASIIFSAVLLLSRLAKAEVAPIAAIGNRFFDSVSGDQFYVKGIAYQEQAGQNGPKNPDTPYVDSLASPETCLRDLVHLKDLGVNVVRVYQVDPTADHQVCVDALAQAGIYVLADLSEPGFSINRDRPVWDTEIFDRYTSVVDALHAFPNVLGFFAGNEVTNSKHNTDASPFVKAAIRDTKKYIREKGYRNIPVGYAANDDADIRGPISSYFVCGDKDQAADFLGLNMYEWCGYSTYHTSGYKERTAEYAGFPVPVFFSEYGCNTVAPRPFTEVEALYGSTMAAVWSGGIAYEYFDNFNRYGVVKEKDGKIIRLDDFAVLQNRLAGIQPPKFKAPNTTDTKSSVCNIKNRLWKGSLELPPSPNKRKCNCMEQMLACVATESVGDIGKLFNEVCKSVDCSGIEADGEKGAYGPFSSCGPRQRLSYALNLHYENNDRRSEYCDFQGRAWAPGFSNASRECREMVSLDAKKAVFEQFGANGLNSSWASSPGVGQLVSETVRVLPVLAVLWVTLALGAVL